MSTTPGGPSGHPTEHIHVYDEAVDATTAGTAQRTRRAKKPTRAPRQAPASKPTPQKGWRKGLYSLSKLVGRPDLVPALSKREQSTYDIWTLENRLRFLAERLQITVSFVNIKGGASKTTTAIYVGSIISNLTRRVVYLLPATQATATSTAALNAGIAPSDTLTVSEFSRLYQQLGSYRAVSSYVTPTPAGLRVISEDSEIGVDANTEFGKEHFQHVASTLHSSVDVLLFDTGNDDVKVGSVVLEAVRRSDVIVFTATADKPVTLEKLGPTIGLYMTDLRAEQNVNLQDGASRSEQQISTREKASNSLVVVSGLTAKEKPDDYKKYAYHHRRGNATQPTGFEGKVFTIPRDKHMATNIVADVHKISAAAYLAYLRLCVAIYENAAELRGINLKAEALRRSTETENASPATMPQPACPGPFSAEAKAAS
ncbi:MAG TPA: hypothetical protein VHD60_02490 [Candidatus Saccharimonadales bacterium]|nr:hypothetical protein [Candidatus Saccharimonadales bacterium]